MKATTTPEQSPSQTATHNTPQDTISGNDTSSETVTTTTTKKKKDTTIAGKNVSGRVWKARKTRFKSIHFQPKGARLTYEERMERKRQQQDMKRLADELKQEKEEEREQLRAKLRKKREKAQEKMWEEKQKELLLRGTMKKKPGRNKVLKPKQMKQARLIADNTMNLRDIA